LRKRGLTPRTRTMKCFLEEFLVIRRCPAAGAVLAVEDSPPPFLTINYTWNNSTLRWFSTLQPSDRRRMLPCRKCASKTFSPPMKPRALR
jgi:hypothetical protein